MVTILGRRWDSFDVYIFDIDGTLINCTDATHYFAFCEALRQLSGRELTLEGVVTHGNTDVGILRDALNRADVPVDKWRSQLAQAQNTMCEFVDSHRHELCVEVLPSARELLSYLRGQGAKLGVATGNLERIGKQKLERADLLHLFDFTAWSDRYESRSEVFCDALEQARALYGSHATICVVGDTPADIYAAHIVELPIIAVATGIFPHEELIGEQPDVCVHSFAELLSSSPVHSR